VTWGRNGTLRIASVASLAAAIVLVLLSGPGEQAPSGDPRAALCGADCFPASHPWLLILAAVLAVAGLIGLRMALKGTGR
jgi:ribose/xylose/arabinose/galactoside ABC-type transport system permease subunit